MNDRPQGGSADLSEKASIELMQVRRHISSDAGELQEALNEATPAKYGIKVNAQYNLQIFNFEKG